jgi:hypothetical protein
LGGKLFLGLPEKDLRGLICGGDTPCRTMGEKTKSREEYSSFFDSGFWKSFLEQELVNLLKEVSVLLFVCSQCSPAN